MSDSFRSSSSQTKPAFSAVALGQASFPAPSFKRYILKLRKRTHTSKQDIIYHLAPLLLKDPTSEQVTSLEVEGPLLTLEDGIEIEQSNGKYYASCLVEHKLQIPEIKAYCGIPLSLQAFSELSEAEKLEVGFLTQLFCRTALYAYPRRKQLGLEAETLSEFTAYCQHPLTWSDNLTVPFRKYKLLLEGDPADPQTKKANFFLPAKVTASNPDGFVKLPWSLLQRSSLLFRPIIHFSSVNCDGSTLWISTTIRSATVYGITPITLISRQEEALARAQADEALLKRLVQRIERHSRKRLLRSKLEPS